MKASACMECRLLLEAYVDGELAGPASEGVRAHLEACPECAAEHTLAISLPGLIRSVASPEPPDTLVPAVMRAVAAERASPALVWGLGAVELVLAGLVLAYLSGLDGLVSLGRQVSGDVSRVVSWGAGSSDLPVPPVNDLVLTLAAVALVAVCAAHLAVLSRTSPRRPA